MRVAERLKKIVNLFSKFKLEIFSGVEYDFELEMVVDDWIKL